MKKIKFDNVLPEPLRDTPIHGVVWNSILELNKGQHYLIMADSGKGKSTFLNIILGLRKDYSGLVFFEDLNIKSIFSLDFANLRSSKIACLFQDLRLFPNLTAIENIELLPNPVFTSAHIHLYAEKLGIPHLLNKPCSKLSLGQQQRVAILRALGQNFDWLLLDEPFSHLDDKNANIMMELIQQRAAEQNAGIIATSLGNKNGFDNFNVLQL